MKTSEQLADNLLKRVAVGKAEAEAKDYMLPDATYTLTNKQAVTILGALIVGHAMMKGDLEIALLAASGLAQTGPEGSAILEKFQNELIARQAPKYIVDAVDATLAEARETNAALS